MKILKEHPSESTVREVFISVQLFLYLRTVYDQVFGLEAHAAELNILWKWKQEVPQNFCIHLPDYTASHIRKLYLNTHSPRVPQISYSNDSIRVSPITEISNALCAVYWMLTTSLFSIQTSSENWTRVTWYHKVPQRRDLWKFGLTAWKTRNFAVLMTSYWKLLLEVIKFEKKFRNSEHFRAKG